MDPDRIHSYLKAACIGLGFDIGEVWWTSTTEKATASTKITRNSPELLNIPSNNADPAIHSPSLKIEFRRHSSSGSNKPPAAMSKVNAEPNQTLLRFAQLYISNRSDNLRSKLVRPAGTNSASTVVQENSFDAGDEEASKHIISPSLIDAIRRTRVEDVVAWATCPRQDGLLGRNDVRLQTAVSMPVLIDNSGHMCVVVMFSRNLITSNDDAMKYLQFIRMSATSSTIPCLLPVCKDPRSIVNQEAFVNDENAYDREKLLREHGAEIALHCQTEACAQVQIQSINGGSCSKSSASTVPVNLGLDGVKAHLYFLRDKSISIAFESKSQRGESASFLDLNNLSDAIQRDITMEPKDCFGIPMLPTDDYKCNVDESDEASNGVGGMFDEASYGVWSDLLSRAENSIPIGSNHDVLASRYDFKSKSSPRRINSDSSLSILIQLSEASESSNDLSEMDHSSDVKERRDHETRTALNKIDERLERLEEFAQAFLGMSVFDIADIWVPKDGDALLLSQVSCMTNEQKNDDFTAFRQLSCKSIVKMWSGAVGRAYASGNPVWSCNEQQICDSNRVHAFYQAGIKTVLSVPIVRAHGNGNPLCILTCYSQTRVHINTDVLRFVQHAVMRLWHDVNVGEIQISNDTPAPLSIESVTPDSHVQPGATKKRPIGEISQKSINLCPSTTIKYESPPIKLISRDFNRMNIPGKCRAPVLGVIDLESSIGMKPDFPSKQMSANFHLPFLHCQVDNNSNAVLLLNKPTVASTHNQPKLAEDNIHPIQLSQLTHTNYSHCGNDTGERNERLSKHLPQDLSSNDDCFAKVINKTSGSLSHVFPCNASCYECLPQTGNIPHNWAGQILSQKAPWLMRTRLCKIQGCNDSVPGRKPYCARHSGNRQCEYKGGCGKCAQGPTRFCISHGGGRRCTFPGCDKGARDKFFCAAHGGGKRCSRSECCKSAVGGSNFCTMHGGGRRCSVENCNKSAQASTNLCVRHGGGKKCTFPGCTKVARGKTTYCAAHGGGVRCKIEGCNRVAIGKMQLCRAHGHLGKNNNYCAANKLSA